MKVDIQIITEGEETAVIRCRQVTPAIKKIIEILDDRTGRLWGKTDEGTVSVSLNGILYLESVDDRVFAYTDDWVLRIDGSLNTFTNELGDERFFRCSKSMIINVNRVIALKSLSSIVSQKGSSSSHADKCIRIDESEYSNQSADFII